MKFQKIDTRHDDLDVDEEQRANLRKLAQHLASVGDDYKHFHMGYFFFTVADDTVEPGRQRFTDSKGEDIDIAMFEVEVDENSFEARIGQCGAVACAIGHGPLAGIPEKAGDINWGGYAARVFGLNAFGRRGSFLFGWEWVSYANTAHDAAERIFYALEHGVPIGNLDFNVFDFHQEVVRV